MFLYFFSFSISGIFWKEPAPDCTFVCKVKLNDSLILQKFINSFKLFFSHKDNCSLNIIDNDEIENFYNNANDIVQFGWKKEAVPIILEKRSILARLFSFLFD